MAGTFLINCDDLGMHTTVNEGICDILAQGVITSTSLMATGHAFDDAASRLKRLGIRNCGVHLTLNSEYPSLPVSPLLGSTVGSLCGPAGHFLADPVQSRAQADSEQVKQEFLAQIAKIESAGLTISHLDGHMFCYDPAVGGPQIFAVAQALSEATGLPMRQLDIDGLGQRPRTRFVWKDHDSRDSRHAFYRALLSSEPAQVEEVIIHPAKDLEALRSFTGASIRRVSDYEFFVGEEFRGLVSENKLDVVGWSVFR